MKKIQKMIKLMISRSLFIYLYKYVYAFNLREYISLGFLMIIIINFQHF